MSLTEFLGLLSGILGFACLYLFTKKKSAEAINKNIETKEKLLDIEKEKVENKVVIDMEEEKRKQILKKGDLSNEELADFFNNIFDPNDKGKR